MKKTNTIIYSIGIALGLIGMVLMFVKGNIEAGCWALASVLWCASALCASNGY